MATSLAVGLLCGPASVLATPPGNAISQQVDIATYQHYLEDLLYTHLGDNRGFGPEHDLARANIVAVLQSHGLPVVLEPFLYNAVTYYNVVATQTGTVTPSQIFVVGAHFDSVNNPGADDNATGTALVMEVARVLSQYRSTRTIKYVLFDREEQGRRGSIAYVAAHAADNMIMAVTADMIGHDSGAYGMDVYGKTTSAAVVNGVVGAIGTYGAGLHGFVNLGNYSFSDHWSFEQAGIPACVIIEDCYICNTNYHTLNDAVDVYPGYLKYPMLNDVVRSVVGYLVDQIPITLWGDADNDADVDNADFNAFLAAYGAAVTAANDMFDFDQDNDIDCADWQAFQAAYEASQGIVPLPSLAVFVNALIGADSSAVNQCVCDLDDSGGVDGADIPPYVSGQ